MQMGVDIVTFKTGDDALSKVSHWLITFQSSLRSPPIRPWQTIFFFSHSVQLMHLSYLVFFGVFFFWNVRQLSKICWDYGLGHIIFLSIYGYNNADQLVVSLSPLFQLSLSHTLTHSFSLTFFRRSTQKCQPSSFLTFVVTTLPFFSR